MAQNALLVRMDKHIRSWESTDDRRATFLQCYRMMTQNMLHALANGEFHNRVWVDRLLHHFADYYFHALEQYDRQTASTPSVWHLAFDMATKSEKAALQDLLLGVNAHINFDLVLTLRDLLDQDWSNMSSEQKDRFFQDYAYVNTIIGRTIDTVQDQVLEPAQPAMRLVDDLMGRMDEWLLGRMITHWRDQVWEYAVALLDAASAGAKAEIVGNVEAHALRRAEAIAGKNWPLGLGAIL